MGAVVIDHCLVAQSHDFEDEAQYYSAIMAGADYIVTRNKKDFPFFKPCPVAHATGRLSRGRGLW